MFEDSGLEGFYEMSQSGWNDQDLTDLPGEVEDIEDIDFTDEDENDDDVEDIDEIDDSMDGDESSALASIGWGTDEDYGCFESDFF